MPILNLTYSNVYIDGQMGRVWRAGPKCRLFSSTGSVPTWESCRAWVAALACSVDPTWHDYIFFILQNIVYIYIYIYIYIFAIYNKYTRFLLVSLLHVAFLSLGPRGREFETPPAWSSTAQLAVVGPNGLVPCQARPPDWQLSHTQLYRCTFGPPGPARPKPEKARIVWISARPGPFEFRTVPGRPMGLALGPRPGP
jgi:hypothetical protein